ncbi:VTC domain-containing protein [Amylibacter sp.]|nr:VTC domain-containing protein [Amylibacter sp.]
MSFRKEKKFRVTISDYHRFQDELHKQGMSELFESRIITSVYFDTIDLNMFHDSEEGVLPRKKVRFRWYNDRNIFTLEHKTSSIEGRFKVTSKKQDIIKQSELYTKNYIDAQYGQIRPVLKVSYERAYFLLNNMRITFDKDITYQNLKYTGNRKYYDPERVIEIKVPATCSDDFVEKIIPFPTARFSKYSRGLLFSHGNLNEA